MTHAFPTRRSSDLAEDSVRRTIRAKKLGRCAGSAKKIADLIWERFAFRADSSEVESVLEALEYFAISDLEHSPATGGYWTVNDDNFTYYFKDEIGRASCRERVCQYV